MKWSLFLLIVCIVCFGTVIYGRQIYQPHGNGPTEKPFETYRSFAEKVFPKRRDYLGIFGDITKFAFPSFAKRSRPARAVDGIGSRLPYIGELLKGTCENNTELNENIKNLATCIKSKPLFATPRDDYIEHVNSCSATTKRILNQCLPPKLRYIPEVLFALAESSIKLLYDDYGEIERGLSPCLPQLRSRQSEEVYRKCVSSINSNDNDKIPGSKEVFCQKYVPVSRCYVKQINETCTINSDLEKFTRDYMEAMTQPCLQI